MTRISVVQLCQRLKSEVIASGDAYKDYNLRIKILDYFIARNPPDDNFEEALKTRLNDPDPAKEQSKVICAEILKAWQTRPVDRL